MLSHSSHPSRLIVSLAFSLDTELPDYDLDTEDETFVNKLKKKMEITPLQFEEMIDRLEKGSGQQVSVTVNLTRSWRFLISDSKRFTRLHEYYKICQQLF